MTDLSRRLVWRIQRIQWITISCLILILSVLLIQPGVVDTQVWGRRPHPPWIQSRKFKRGETSITRPKGS